MRIYITGINGFLGRNLATTLCHEYQLRGSQRSTDYDSDENSFSVFTEQNFELVTDDIIRFRPDIIIHTICCFGRKNESAKQIYEVNFNMGQYLLKRLIETKKRTYFLNLSTCLPKNLNLYSSSKIKFSEFGRNFTKQSEYLNFVNLVTYQVFGPEEDKTKFVNFLLHALIRGDDTIAMTTGKQVRDFIYINDFVHAVNSLIRNIFVMDLKADVEIGTGNGITLRHFAEMAKSISDSETEIVFGSVRDRNDEPPKMVADITSLSNLGWQPRYDLKQALQATINILRSSKGN